MQSHRRAKEVPLSWHTCCFIFLWCHPSPMEQERNIQTLCWEAWDSIISSCSGISSSSSNSSNSGNNGKSSHLLPWVRHHVKCSTCIVHALNDWKYGKILILILGISDIWIFKRRPSFPSRFFLKTAGKNLLNYTGLSLQEERK